MHAADGLLQHGFEVQQIGIFVEHPCEQYMRNSFDEQYMTNHSSPSPGEWLDVLRLQVECSNWSSAGATQPWPGKVLIQALIAADISGLALTV